VLQGRADGGSRLVRLLPEACVADRVKAPVAGVARAALEDRYAQLQQFRLFPEDLFSLRAQIAAGVRPRDEKDSHRQMSQNRLPDFARAISSHSNRGNNHQCAYYLAIYVEGHTSAYV